MTLLPSRKVNSILDLLNSTYREDLANDIYSVITAADIISELDIAVIKAQLAPLVGLQLDILKIPKDALIGFEPSQIGTAVGTIMDACLPQLPIIMPENTVVQAVGLQKHEGILGEREGYPDFKLSSGKRLELKLLYVDPTDVSMKRPPTKREPSARLTQKVTYKNVDPKNDVLLVIAYQLQPLSSATRFYSPTIVDLEVLPVIDCIIARDIRLCRCGGRWFGTFETPTMPSKKGKKKLAEGQTLDSSAYGRKQSEGMDLNEDTNFGKLKRIPQTELRQFLKKYSIVELAESCDEEEEE